MSASQLRRYRGGRCAMIFRSRCWPSIRSTPSGSRLGCAATKGCRAGGRDRALEALRQVRIPSPSGGWMLTRTRCPADAPAGDDRPCALL